MHAHAERGSEEHIIFLCASSAPSAFLFPARGGR